MSLLRLDYTRLASMSSLLLPPPPLAPTSPPHSFLSLFLPEVDYHVTNIPMEKPYGEKLDNNHAIEPRSIFSNLSQTLR